MTPLTVFSHPVLRSSSGGRCQSPPMIHGPLNVPNMAPMHCSRSSLNARLCSQLHWR